MSDLTHEQLERMLTNPFTLNSYKQAFRQLLAAMERIEAAKYFVPLPNEMSGYDDPDAEERDRAMVSYAAKFHGIKWPGA